MQLISLENVSLDYPLYDSQSRSLTRSFTRGIPIGGRIKQKQGERTSILALDDVSVSLKDGDRVALLGHNGAGKTSLLKLLTGFYEPSSGKLVREGKVSALLNLMAGMDINLNGYENILLCGILHKLSREEVISRTDAIAEFSGLGPYLDLPVYRYSSGMMLRLAFAICTSIDCDILLLDEMVGTGDQEFIGKARERLSDLIFRSAILVFATHNVEIAKTLCNKALYLEHGKLQAFGEINEVLAVYQASHSDSLVAAD